MTRPSRPSGAKSAAYAWKTGINMADATPCSSRITISAAMLSRYASAIEMVAYARSPMVKKVLRPLRSER